MREEQTKTTTERLIFHVDVNSAFLSWESVRRIKEGLPDLRDIPACIGGDPTKRTGIVVAKSIPAKKCGVQTGEPVAMALRKCPNMVIVPSDSISTSGVPVPSRKSAPPTPRSWNPFRSMRYSSI